MRANGQAGPAPLTATLRNWRPGDRVRLRHSGSSRKVKEVIARLHVTGADRTLWPVLEVDGRIVWMRGVELEPEPGLVVTAITADFAAETAVDAALPAKDAAPPASSKPS